MALKNNHKTANFSLNIAYEDGDIIVVNKPAGINVHPDKFHADCTLIQFIAQKFPEIKKIGDDPERPGVIHRLDRDTSGLLIIAKNQESFEYFKKQFKEKKIKKTYIALLHGKLGEKIGDKGIIEFPIGRSAKNPILRVAICLPNRQERKTRGELKTAITEYKILKFYGSPGAVEFTLVEAYPKTGRTHQIRVHFKALEHPVTGDKLYSSKFLNESLISLGLTRQFLHAISLEFNLQNGLRIKLETDLPQDLLNFLSKLKTFNLD